MKRYIFNKLIRSKITTRMKEQGIVINSTALDDQQYIQQLKNKIIEEANEVAEANSRDDLIIELADVIEVIHAIASASNISIQDIETARLKKKEINGPFTANDYINYIDVSVDNHKLIEYLENKNRPYIYKKT